MTLENAPAARIALAEAAAAAAVPPAPPVAPSRPVRFTGEAGAFWRLLLRGALLLAVTLGIYRFWLATDVRRFGRTPRSPERASNTTAPPRNC